MLKIGGSGVLVADKHYSAPQSLLEEFRAGVNNFKNNAGASQNFRGQSKLITYMTLV
jgi:hypothetical protein